MSVLISLDAVAARRAAIAGSPDLQAMAEHLQRDVQAVLAHPLYVPDAKALLSRWGAHCRDDGAELGFDPWSPHAHRCTRCGRIWNTEQSHRWWVYWYQLWLAERTWMLALRSQLADDAAAEARALESLAALVERYDRYPAHDNVLGPSRPFFSTYLESVWVLQLAAAADLLEQAQRVPVALGRDLRARLFRPSSALIADYDEGGSNRQVWNATALFALGAVLDDAALRDSAAHGPAGILAVLDRGLLDDGLWYEGENYHWFALRGLTWAAGLLRSAGAVDLWSDDGRAGRKFRAAFRAPVLTALPDFTFPARRDAKFGVSLRQRRMAELWEMAGTAGTGAWGPGGEDWVSGLLAHVYDAALAPAEEGGASITEVERQEAPQGLRRGQLGWKGLLFAAPELPLSGEAAWPPATAHLEATGLAVFRRDEGRTYVSLDYGESGGAHGHPDRLNLTLVADAVPWLLDFGTGSYVAPSLGWYRASLAHNAPLIDFVNQIPARGSLVAFDDRAPWGWACAMLPNGTAYETAAIQRTIVVGPGYVLDVVQMAGDVAQQLAVPWHGLGRPAIEEFGVTFARDGRSLSIHLAARQPFQVLLHKAPGPPVDGATEELEFAIAVSQGEEVTLSACLDLGAGIGELECIEDRFVVRHRDGRVHFHQATDDGWQVELDRGDPVVLGGLAEEQGPVGEVGGPRPEVSEDRGQLGGIAGQALGQGGWSGASPRSPLPAPGLVIPRVGQAPALDGSLAGFPSAPQLVLDRAEQFRRAEDAWPGAAAFSARGYLARDDSHLYVSVDVTCPSPWFRPADAPNPEWENESPDIHSDGVQLYLEPAGFYGWLLVPDPDDPSRVKAAAVHGSDAAPEMVTGGGWALTPDGYRLTVAIDVPELLEGADCGVDLYVNRKPEERERRSGQLVWSGAQGQRLYLAGDRPLAGALPRLRLG